MKDDHTRSLSVANKPSFHSSPSKHNSAEERRAYTYKEKNIATDSKSTAFELVLMNNSAIKLIYTHPDFGMPVQLQILCLTGQISSYQNP